MKNPIPADWQGEWCQWAICWPDSPLWRGLLLGLITSPMRGRFWDEKTGSIKDIQVIGREIYDRNVEMEESIMSCSGGAELALAIRYLADSLANKPCCGSGAPGTAGGVGTGGAPGTGSGPSDGLDDEGSYPEGYASYAEYKATKCAISHWIVDQFKRDIQSMQVLSIGTTTGLSVISGLLGASIITPIPGDEIIVLAGIILLTVAEGLLATVLGEVEDGIDLDYDKIVCALYNAGNVGDAKTDVTAALNAAIDAVSGEPITFWAKQMFPYFFNLDSLNRLFDPKDTTRTYPTATCDCQEEGNLVLTIGTLISGELIADESYHELVIELASSGAGTIIVGLETKEYNDNPGLSTYNDFFYCYGLEMISGTISLSNNGGYLYPNKTYDSYQEWVASDAMIALNLYTDDVSGTVRVKIAVSTTNSPPP